VRLGRLTNGKDWRLWTISAAVTVITAATGTEVALLFVAAGILMLVIEEGPRLRRPPSAALAAALPASAAIATVQPAAVLALGLFFLKAGAFIFGSGLAVVPFLREGVVDQYHWLTERQFLDAVAVGLITPGPIVITAAFIGYLVAGLPGAIVSTIAIFTPIYAGVVLVGRWFVRHKDDSRVRAFVKGVTAAAAGAIAGATIVLARQAVVDLPTALVGLVSLGFLLAVKDKEPLLVLAAAVAGVLLHR
jgi:chromate transporter